MKLLKEQGETVYRIGSIEPRKKALCRPRCSKAECPAMPMRTASSPLYGSCVLLLFLAALCATPLQAADLGYPHNIDPARLRAEVSALTQDDANHAIEPVNVLFAGSSTVKGWQPSLRQDMDPLDVLARGFGGATLPDVLYYTPELVLKYRPGNVVVYAGDNDIGAYGASPIQVRDAFEQLLQRIRMELPNCRVFFFLSSRARSVGRNGRRCAKPMRSSLRWLRRASMFVLSTSLARCWTPTDWCDRSCFKRTACTLTHAGIGYGLRSFAKR